MSKFSISYVLRVVPEKQTYSTIAWFALDTDKGRILGISGHRVHVIHAPKLEGINRGLIPVSREQLVELAKKNTRPAWAGAHDDILGSYLPGAEGAIKMLDDPSANSFGLTTIGDIRSALERKDSMVPTAPKEAKVSLFELKKTGGLYLNGSDIGDAMGDLPSSRAFNTRYLRDVLFGRGETEVGIGMKRGMSQDIGSSSWRGWLPTRFQLLDTPYSAIVAPMSYP